MTLNTFYFPFDRYTSVGGPSSFMINLKTYLDKNRIVYANEIKNADHIFFPVSFDKSQLRKFKKRHGKIIQRLDGIYYPTKHGDSYTELNNNIKDIYRNFSDHIIFQSNYSKQQCFTMYGKKEKESYSIIINGVNKDIFYPANAENSIKDEIVFITTGSFRNIDMIEPIIKALDNLTGRIKFKLKIVGPVINPVINKFLAADFVEYLGEKTLEDVACCLREADIFLYSYLNPPCPNAVLEAISSGLPVVGFNSGSMSELLFFSKELLAPVSDDIFQRYEDLYPDKLTDKILLCLNNFEYYKKCALNNHHLYSFEACGRQYMQVFQQFMKMEKSTRYNALQLNPPNRFFTKVIARLLQNQTFEAIFKNILHQKTDNYLIDLIEKLIVEKASALSPFEALNFLFDIENRLYRLEGRASIRYGNGLHTKHRHIKYHDFFIQRIPDGSRVFDVGCGNGALTYDISQKLPGTSVYGIDLVLANIEYAENKYKNDNITFIHGDALDYLPDVDFNIIILSNVLEHIENREELIQKLIIQYHPEKILIRVPLFERDWRVPLKRELGVDYRLDATHFIEYTTEDFFKEIKLSGLSLTHYQINWGEIWAEAIPNAAT